MASMLKYCVVSVFAFALQISPSLNWIKATLVTMAIPNRHIITYTSMTRHMISFLISNYVVYLLCFGIVSYYYFFWRNKGLHQTQWFNCFCYFRLFAHEHEIRFCCDVF